MALAMISMIANPLSILDSEEDFLLKESKMDNGLTEKESIHIYLELKFEYSLVIQSGVKLSHVDSPYNDNKLVSSI